MVPTDTTTDENKKVHRKARAGIFFIFYKLINFLLYEN